tara:strand:+ start:483 stop:632 length:150 start_codon:yes stop_codon:yes gene_type:complete
MNKVTIATKIPKKPRINIGEFGKSYTGTFIIIGRKLKFKLGKYVMLFYL